MFHVVLDVILRIVSALLLLLSNKVCSSEFICFSERWFWVCLESGIQLGSCSLLVSGQLIYIDSMECNFVG